MEGGFGDFGLLLVSLESSLTVINEKRLQDCGF